MKKVIAFIFAYSIILIGFSQPYNQLLNLSDSALSEKKFSLAIAYIERIEKLYPEKLDAKFWFNYGTSLRKTNQYEKSIDAYLDLLEISPIPKEYYSAYFWVAENYKYIKNYKKALLFFKKTKRKYTQKKNSYFYKKATYEIAHYNPLLSLLKNNPKIKKLKKLNALNSSSSDLSVSHINDSLIIFASSREEKVKLFVARLIKKKWKISSLNLNGELENFDVANPSYDSKTKELYFSACFKGNCSIYKGNLKGDTLSNILTLNRVNNEGSINTQPSVTTIGNKTWLFFSSNRNKTYHMDIWKSEKKGLYFLPPTPLSKKINSYGNEITPFYDNQKDILYFSSNWHTGKGGYDIFSTKLNNENPSEMVVKNENINSSYNDYYPYKFKNTFYLSSNKRDGEKTINCCNNLYSHVLPATVNPIKSDTSKKERVKTIEDIRKLLPITLYFDNDRPNPKTLDTTTHYSYNSLVYEYYERKNIYTAFYAKNSSDKMKKLDAFFENDLLTGIKQLKKVALLLKKELDNETNISLIIKGYASPLAKSDYNLNLTKRRIQSLKNFLQRFNKSALLPYLLNRDNKNSLSIKYIPFGESKTQAISDDLKNLKESVYGINAIRSRKLTIENVEID